MVDLKLIVLITLYIILFSCAGFSQQNNLGDLGNYVVDTLSCAHSKYDNYRGVKSELSLNVYKLSKEDYKVAFNKSSTTEKWNFIASRYTPIKTIDFINFDDRWRLPHLFFWIVIGVEEYSFDLLHIEYSIKKSTLKEGLTIKEIVPNAREEFYHPRMVAIFHSTENGSIKKEYDSLLITGDELLQIVNYLDIEKVDIIIKNKFDDEASMSFKIIEH